MNTAVVNVKVDPKVKREAKIVAQELGFSLSSLINAYLKQLIKTKTITFSTVSEEPTEYLLEALKESKEDIKKGRVISFKNSKEAVNYFDRLIDNDYKESKN